MSGREVYLDNSATTRPKPQVVQAVVETLEHDYGNPSSLHRKGLQAERHIKRARRALAALLEVDRDTITFCSGATEANNIALRGAARGMRRWGTHIVTTSVEHSSVLETCYSLAEAGFDLTELPVDSRGLVSMKDFEAAIRDETVLVSMMFVNNEVGSVQPVQEVGRYLARLREQGRHLYFHVDAVQAIGKVAVAPVQQHIDMLSLSAHKFHGPKGVGALYTAPHVRLQPPYTGGDQEAGLRPGTENVPGIAGLGAAVELLGEWKQSAARTRELRDSLVERVTIELNGVRVNGTIDPELSAPHIANLSFPGLRAEVLAHFLEAEGIYVSTGSACHSRSANPSHVLAAMGLTDADFEGAIRISLADDNTLEDIDYLIDKLKVAVPELRQIARRH